MEQKNSSIEVLEEEIESLDGKIMADFNPQPDPPGRQKPTEDFNPQPDPPGRPKPTEDFNPQPDPPGKQKL